MGLCDHYYVILQTSRARCALNKEILDLLNEESVSGESNGRARFNKFTIYFDLLTNNVLYIYVPGLDSLLLIFSYKATSLAIPPIHFIFLLLSSFSKPFPPHVSNLSCILSCPFLHFYLPILTLVLCNDVVRNHRVLKDTPRHVTRFIALGAVGNPDKKNRVRIMLWIHRFRTLHGERKTKKQQHQRLLVNHLMIICIVSLLYYLQKEVKQSNCIEIMLLHMYNSFLF